MRINEIASAQEQIELWKLISNSVWQSLQQQQQEEQKRKAADAAKRKSGPKPKAKARPRTPIPAKVQSPRPPAKPNIEKQPFTSNSSARSLASTQRASGDLTTTPNDSAAVQRDRQFTVSNRKQDFSSRPLAPSKPIATARKA